MAHNRVKYDIEVQNDDTIKRNQIFLDFMRKNVQSSGCIVFTCMMSFDRYDNERTIEESE